MGTLNIKKLRCSVPDCDCKAEFQCPECGINYCQECASNMDYECDCVEPPHLESISKVN